MRHRNAASREHWPIRKPINSQSLEIETPSRMRSRPRQQRAANITPLPAPSKLSCISEVHYVGNDGHIYKGKVEMNDPFLHQVRLSFVDNDVIQPVPYSSLVQDPPQDTTDESEGYQGEDDVDPQDQHLVISCKRLKKSKHHRQPQVDIWRLLDHLPEETKQTITYAPCFNGVMKVILD